ncbi:MAG: malectin domain-containing carbohydrate-binding protein, partial [Bacteroidia bacterium]|nr:malectin domain-containing carbohydrate-binding protein [Bacteroidia bacterium]
MAKEAHWLTAPTLDIPISDISGFVGAGPVSFSLHPYVSDDQGDAGLTYSIESNSGTHIGASILSDVLTLTFPAANTDTATLILRATDIDGMFVQDTFVVSAVVSEVLYRVNAGGSAETALDAPNMDWAVDDASTPSAYHNTGNTKGNTALGTRGPALPAYAPDDLFQQERWDGTAAPEMMWEFPAGVAGVYRVNLFFMNNYGGTSNVGQRVFDVIFEGQTLLDNYDIVADAGHKVATMKTVDVLVTDGVLDIDFGHVVENPLVNAIEIIGPPVPPNNGLLSIAQSRLHILATELGMTSGPSSFTLTNTGTDPIIVSAASVSGSASGDFAVSAGLPAVINPGGNVILSVTMTPSSIGIRSATLEISHNAGNSNPLLLALRGEGIPPAAIPVVLFRVNHGGGLEASGDASAPDWAGDKVSSGSVAGTATAGFSSPYLVAGGTHAFGSLSAVTSDGSIPAQA